jgi:epsilon-lactone hydrolase
MLRLVATNFCLRHLSKRYLRYEQDFAHARAGMEHALRLMPLPRGTVLDEQPLAGDGRSLAALRVRRFGRGPTILWLHGGAYCLGSPRGFAGMTAALARRLRGGVVLPDYRLAPEHPFPAAVEDCFLAYRALLDEGVDPACLVLGGDSAGGGLAFVVLHLLLAEGLPKPAAAVAFSPWADLTASGESLRTLADREVMLPVERLPEIRDRYLAGADPRDPRASPVFGRFEGAPPVLIQSSRHEILRDDARRMVARLRECGVVVTHDEWEGVPHVWQLFHSWLPEGDRALDAAGAFVAGHVVPPPRAGTQMASR